MQKIPTWYVFPILLPTELLRILVATMIPVKGGSHKCLSDGTTRSGMLSHGFGLRVVTASLLPGFQLQVISIMLEPASLASPAPPGSLEITSQALAADIRDAKETCSMNTLLEPESSFNASLSNWLSNSDFEMTYVHNSSKMHGFD